MSGQDADRDDAVPDVNEVVVGGRVSGRPLERKLPSGDVVVQFRVVVTRPVRRGRASGSCARIDTIDVSCWTKPLQRKAGRLQAGDRVIVRGALRRRFWRSVAGASSRYEVEVTEIDRRRKRAGTPVRGRADPAAQ